MTDQRFSDNTPLEGSLFERSEERAVFEIPLAERMRPQSLDEYAGQGELLAPGRPLRLLLEGGRVPSCILYGPPGIGKTTLVRLMSKVTNRELIEINAVSAKVETLRSLVDKAQEEKRFSGRSALAFVDELYHFNSKQQNVLLPAVEKGDLVLVGTTTENPWFSINKTLLSRMVVYTLKPLGEDDLCKLLRRALDDRVRGLGMLEVAADEAILRKIAALAGGDARQALTRLEAAVSAAALGGGKVLTEEITAASTGMATQRYDRGSSEHYHIISALIKSIRGSDPDAAVYWLARMLSAGDDLRFICRRLCISAAEDVGLADPFALVIAQNAAAAVDRVGLPEAQLILSEAAVYLSNAPKSSSTYEAINAAMKAVAEGDLMEVPSHLRNDGEGYIYPHDFPAHWAPQAYLPEVRRFYKPGGFGAEVRMRERLKKLWKRFSEEEKTETDKQQG